MGVARSGDWGNAFFIREGLEAFGAETQRLHDKAGMRLVHLHSDVDKGKRFWAGIARSGNWANSCYFERDIDQFGLTSQALFDINGLRTTAVEFFDT